MKEKMICSSCGRELAEESAVRGTDATGIAFNENGKMIIFKDPKSAYKLNLKHSDNVTAVIGHTSHSTQGSEKKNCNNHPFSGRCKNARFALANNGVLINDKELRKQYHLPKSKIETDSYIAVQLLEHKKTIDSNSIKFMDEAVEGNRKDYLNSIERLMKSGHFYRKPLLKQRYKRPCGASGCG